MELIESLHASIGSSPEPEEDYYEKQRPMVKSITVPETVKRRIPAKHYVYKVVVKWTDGKETIIYRKYSFFFDFVVKLNQLVGSLSPTCDEPKQLPDLPGRVLFGRSEVHQVAEKRRKKIEEFCQKLIELPPAISHSSLVLGFFNTWPDDTMLRRPSVFNTHVITSPIIPPNGAASKSPSSPNISSHIPTSNSFTSSTRSQSSIPEMRSMSIRDPSASPSPPPIMSPLSDTALEAIISHPDEMESLEQYKVLANYERKDAHQVSLQANQLVHVIEKHDTGWWMVMSDDEQGYAPASYLEPVEDVSDQDVHPENLTDQVYEAMENYFAENDDEITMKAGQKVEVISKSMDGWWKIRCNGLVGYSPAALIRRRDSGDIEHIYESEKSIYEGLNIHRPPPRRNTVDRSAFIKVMPGKAIPSNHYDRPKNHQLNNIYIDSAEGESDEDTPTSNQTEGKGKSIIKTGAKGGKFLSPKTKPSSVEFSEDNHIYESEDLCADSAGIDNDDSIYENTDYPAISEGSLVRKHSSPVLLLSSQGNPVEKERSPVRPMSTSAVLGGMSYRDYEDPDAALDALEGEEYVDMDMSSVHNTYIDPDDLRRGSSSASGSFSSSGKVESSPGPNVAVSPKQNSMVPDVAVSPQQNGMVPVFDDDYIVMDPLYVEPPLEDTDGNSDTLKADKTPPKGSPVAKRPLPPAPYTTSTSNTPGKLSRAKSLENLIASFNSPSKRSPEQNRKPQAPSNPTAPSNLPPTPPPLPTTPRPASPRHTSSTSDLPKPNRPKLPPNRTRLATNGPIDPPTPPRIQGGVTSHPLTRNISPPHSITGLHRDKPDRPPHPILHQSVSTPPGERSHAPLSHAITSPDLTPTLPKTYVSMADYSSQTEQCLSFSAGDKCVLIRSQDDWWLVNIGGQEGWTPGEYWKEDVKRESNLPKPPSFAPPKKIQNVRKPRSRTVGTTESSITTSLDLTTNEHKLEHRLEEESSLTQSMSSATQDSIPPKTKGPLPPPPSKLKPVKPPKPRPGIPVKPDQPPKPRPGVPVKPDQAPKPRPGVPVKPDMNMKRDSASPSSPPNNRKSMSSVSPSPPPPPLPPANTTKKMLNYEKKSISAPSVNGHAHNSSNSNTSLDDYGQLSEVSTTSIENSPWFLGKMERGQAEQFLMDHGRQREFLIRERTTKDGFYALSVRYHYSCKHFNIDPSPDGQYTMGTLSFPSIEQIIQHYQMNSLFIHDGQHVTLSQAVKKKQRPSDAYKHNSSHQHS